MTTRPDFFSTLGKTISSISNYTPPPARRELLDGLVEWLVKHRNTSPETKARVMFICTHNSRRSQLAQVWLTALAKWHNVDGIEAFSGGTEQTVFHPNAISALKTEGFGITVADAESSNPAYHIAFGPNSLPNQYYSKRFDTTEHPQSGFAAVMVCTDADTNCPVVPGASTRFSLPYDDPKEADGTSEVSRVYHNRSLLIASEVNYLLQQIKNHG